MNSHVIDNLFEMQKVMADQGSLSTVFHRDGAESTAGCAAPPHMDWKPATTSISWANTFAQACLGKLTFVQRGFLNKCRSDVCFKPSQLLFGSKVAPGADTHTCKRSCSTQDSGERVCMTNVCLLQTRNVCNPLC